MDVLKLLLRFATVIVVCVTVAYCFSHWPGTTIRHELYEHKDEAEKENLNTTGCVELFLQHRCIDYDI